MTNIDKESDLMLRAFGDCMGQSIEIKEKLLLPGIVGSPDSRISSIKVHLFEKFIRRMMNQIAICI